MKSILVMAFALGALFPFAGRCDLTPAQIEKIRADKAWSQVSSLMSAMPEPLPSGIRTTPDYDFWLEYSRRLLFAEGLRFYRAYPQDERRWAWMETTFGRRFIPAFVSTDDLWRRRADPAVKPKPDDTARLEWQRQVEVLKAECIASPQAPAALRLHYKREPLSARLDEYVNQAPPQGAWLHLGKDLASLAGEFAGDEDTQTGLLSRTIQIRSIANRLLRQTEKRAPAEGQAVRNLFLSSGNPVLETLATGNDRIAQARTEPMAMRFAAVDGREVDLQALRGKLVLVNFWAAKWCGACKAQEPLMKRIYSKYRELGFEIIGIACEKEPGDRQYLTDYLAEEGIAWPQFFDGKGMDNAFTQRFGFTSIPQYFLIGKDGRLIEHTGSSSGLNNLEAVVRRNLGLPELQAGDHGKVLGDLQMGVER